MKKKLILLLILIITSSHCAYAGLEGKVISDSTTKKKKMEDFDGLNQYTENFFTPVQKPKKKTDDNEEKIVDDGTISPGKGTVPPVKKLRIMIQNHRNSKNLKETVIAEEPVSKNQALLDCDVMEYFAERTELEANGNVVMYFPKNDSTIKADKVVYNQASNLIKASGHVVLINSGQELLGEYMQIDMNEENAFMDNPESDLFQIRSRAKKGYMYGDKIIQEQGSLYVTKKTMINLRADMFGPNMDDLYVKESDKAYFQKEGHGEKFKIKTNELIITAKKEHDTVALKQAEIYFNNKKVGKIPSITIHTNKNMDYIEAAYPELGTMMNLGMYAGPGFVFDTPMGTNLKVIPILNYQSNGDEGDSKLGYGAIAKFKSGTNKTDFAYGTSNEVFIMRGKQRLDDNLYFQYGSNAYLDDWFLGFRMPRLMGELVYEDGFLSKNFIAKKLDMSFRNRISAGYVQDGQTGVGKQAPLGEDGIGTTRFKYMAEVAQTLYNFGTPYNSAISARLDLVGQGSVGVYGTGATQMIARIGPRIHSQYKNWMQDVGYFQSEYSDHTPLINFDRYMYGRSNAYLRETVRLHKYFALSWFGSLNLSKDSWDGKMLQENTFFLSIGPDDVKLNVGYDTIRQQSFVTMALALDAKGSTLEYKKMVIKNPEKLGKNENGNNTSNNSFINHGEDDQGIERAEVINIEDSQL